MKLDVIKGFLHPHDLAKKTARRAVILGRDEEGNVAVAPATTYFQRTGSVPPGHVLLSVDSPARRRSGFDADLQILINIRDTVRVKEGSPWTEGAEKVGTLDLSVDSRLLRNFGEELRAFPIRDRVYE